VRLFEQPAALRFGLPANAAQEQRLPRPWRPIKGIGMTTLMVQGTTSDAGKSTLVTALCRWLLRQGVAVVPFKPQNMALNSAVTADGGEIGRAQAVQAQACRLAPHTDMNPVLLKPNSDTGAQVIIHGRAVTSMNAVAYHDYKAIAMQAVLASHERLSGLSGGDGRRRGLAGRDQPARRRHRQHGLCRSGRLPGDPGRRHQPWRRVRPPGRHAGAAVAQRAGAGQGLRHQPLPRRHRLLQPGLDWLEQRTGKPVLGVLPYVTDLHLEAEDGIDVRQADKGERLLKVVVPVLPRISNHTDFDPLRLHPQVDLQFIGPGQPIPPADLIILPGSSVRGDLAQLRARGWDTAIARHLRYGGKLIGICGGLQMLGREVHDPLGLEGPAGSSAGLGLLDYETVLEAEKQLRNVRGTLALEQRRSAATKSMPVSPGPGAGASRRAAADGRCDGAISADGQILATYLHGLFEGSQSCAALLRWAGLADVQAIDYEALRERDIERLADLVEQHLDTAHLRQLCGITAHA
jgi:adenosylcobyric acid synthase